MCVPTYSVHRALFGVFGYPVTLEVFRTLPCFIAVQDDNKASSHRLQIPFRDPLRCRFSVTTPGEPDDVAEELLP
jgi:hypothetical protein